MWTIKFAKVSIDTNNNTCIEDIKTIYSQTTVPSEKDSLMINNDIYSIESIFFNYDNDTITIYVK